YVGGVAEGSRLVLPSRRSGYKRETRHATSRRGATIITNSASPSPGLGSAPTLLGDPQGILDRYLMFLVGVRLDRLRPPTHRAVLVVGSPGALPRPYRPAPAGSGSTRERRRPVYDDQICSPAPSGGAGRELGSRRPDGGAPSGERSSPSGPPRRLLVSTSQLRDSPHRM